MTGIYSLKGTVKHYDWGGIDFIPALLKIDNPGNKPFAEYWMGIHPLGVSKVQTPDGSKGLDEMAPKLPYLFKILDVKEMLSIQVHPSKSAAEKEFARENQEGIPLDSPNRNYKDDNHKPEMAAALGDFYLLHGFKAEKLLTGILKSVPELNSLLPIFEASGYEGLYRKVMTMPQADVNRALQPLVDRIVPLYKENKLDKSNEDFWAARAAISFARGSDIDRGIFSIYLFNIVHLKKGEAIFQGAGLPHAYLEGQNVELMANSDNVLRGGLTSKHIDVNELLKHVRCEPTIPNILRGAKAGDHTVVFNTPVKDFQLTMMSLGDHDKVEDTAASTEIIIVTEGRVGTNNDLELQKGTPAAVTLPGTSYRITGISAKSTVFKASVPIHNR